MSDLFNTIRILSSFPFNIFNFYRIGNNLKRNILNNVDCVLTPIHELSRRVYSIASIFVIGERNGNGLRVAKI